MSDRIGKNGRVAKSGSKHLSDKQEIRGSNPRTSTLAGQFSLDVIDANVMGFVMNEIQAARATYPRFNSAHEAFGILYEEVDELWDEVRRVKQTTRLTGAEQAALEAEAIQVAGMAIRLVTDICRKRHAD
jgi:hypothetical protein